jgi:hypothetical protein
MPLDGVFGFFEGVAALGQLMCEGLIGLGSLGREKHPRDERIAGFAFLFIILAVVAIVGVVLYDVYNPTKNTQIACDTIARNMADKDPFKDIEGGSHILEKDGWGNPIRYSRTTDEEDPEVVHHLVQSSGADGILNTSDDLFAESKSQSVVKAVGKSVGKGAKEFVKGVWNGIWD